MASAAGRIAAGRLRAQQIARPQLARPADLVAWLGAVQAQDYRASLWAVGLRLSAPTSEAAIEEAIANGDLLRLHALRGTWQLVAPADACWLVGLVAPRILASLARRHAELALDRPTLRKSLRALTRALAGGAHLTRAELGEALERAGVATTGQRLPHLVGHAELAGLLCNGRPRGKQATFALLDGRVPRGAPAFSGEEALAELARRYFRSRGPATLDDFRWWSGLPAAEARTAVEAAAKALASQVIDGRTYWLDADGPASPAARGVHLLPAFDEYLIGYRDRAAVLDGRHSGKLNAGGGMISPAVVQDGRVIGTWRRTLGRQKVTVAVGLFATPTARQRQALNRAARRYGAFLGLTAEVTVGRRR